MNMSQRLAFCTISTSAKLTYLPLPTTVVGLTSVMSCDDALQKAFYMATSHKIPQTTTTQPLKWAPDAGIVQQADLSRYTRVSNTPPPKKKKKSQH